MKDVDIKKAIVKFAGQERQAAEAAKETEQNQVEINPNCYIAKEIKYQTALIHQILEEIWDIKGNGNRSPHCFGLKRFFGSKGR